MSLVLCPGNIYLRAKPSSANGFTSYSHNPDGAQSSPPGIQLLATCKQAYEEGHRMYYSGNMFHLPPGPLKVTDTLFEMFQPNNVALIRRVSFRASSMDLTPAPIVLIEQASQIQGRPSPSTDRRYAREVLRFLNLQWYAKALFLATELPAINSIRIEAAQRFGTFDRSPYSPRLSVNIDHMFNVCEGLFREIESRIICKIIEVGWKTFRDSWSPEYVQETEDAASHFHDCVTR